MLSRTKRNKVRLRLLYVCLQCLYFLSLKSSRILFLFLIFPQCNDLDNCFVQELYFILCRKLCTSSLGHKVLSLEFSRIIFYNCYVEELYFILCRKLCTSNLGHKVLSLEFSRVIFYNCFGARIVFYSLP